MGNISHAKSFPAGKSGFVPGAYRIVFERVSQCLSLGPFEGFVEVGIRGLEDELSGWSLGGASLLAHGLLKDE
jgi:hypothetical protein